MAITLLNSAEGVTPSGTAMTAGSGGNTGGASGNFFDVVNLGGTGVVASDSAQKAHGSLSTKITTGGTASLCFVAWTTSITGSPFTTMWCRIYVYISASPPAANIPICRFLTSGAQQCARMVINTSGKLTFNDGANTVQITSTTTIPANQWFRIEAFCTSSATVGQLEFKLFTTADATSPTETQTSAATLNTNAGIAQWQVGVTSVAAANATVWVDDLGLTDQGYLGPAAVSAVSLLPQQVKIRRPPLLVKLNYGAIYGR